MEEDNDPRLKVYTPEQCIVADDIVTWQELVSRYKVESNTLSVWFGRPSKKIGATGYNLRQLSIRPDHRPPLFLLSVVGPALKKEVGARRTPRPS